MALKIFSKRPLKTNLFLLLFILASFLASSQSTPTPDILWGKLFVDVQMNRVFPDNKTFVDCVPKYEPSVILKKYNEENKKNGFDLKKFVEDNFTIPITQNVQVKEGLPLKEHLEQLWDVLTRKADVKQHYSSLLPLPKPYIVPGGRFREVYYWDSYFTMQGLAVSNRYDLIEDMVDNFKSLIDNYGHIPNGNRNYYLSRSQPPYYAMMVDLLEQKKGSGIYKKYYSAMEKEHRFWMLGESGARKNGQYLHCVKMPDGSILNRYRDNKNAPREESYVEDVNTAKSYKNGDGLAYTNLRSSAESGMDFCSRWFADTLHLNTIETIDIIPVDLNCLLYEYEMILSKAAKANGLAKKSGEYKQMAQKRKATILKYFWDNDNHFFFDYDLKEKHLTELWCISSVIPLFVNIATKEQGDYVQQQISEKFLKDGGIVTSIYHTGEQWDAPNGWAPLQWIAVKGLLNYHYDDLAKTAAERWMALNEKVFQSTGKMLEKYNVENIHLDSGGGEYPTQDGFGWSNGIYLKFYELFKGK